jgi:hypothetical protein
VLSYEILLKFLIQIIHVVAKPEMSGEGDCEDADGEGGGVLRRVIIHQHMSADVQRNDQHTRLLLSHSQSTTTHTLAAVGKAVYVNHRVPRTSTITRAL